MEPRTNAPAMMPLLTDRHKLRFLHVKERDFKKEVVALQSPIQEMKICAVLSKSDGQNGNVKSNIIDAQSLKIPFLVSKVSLVAN